MISKALHTLENGLKMMRSNSKLFFVGVLVFVFPILFVWITQSFFITAYDNIHTAQKQKVSLLHDAIASSILANSSFEDPTTQLMQKIIAENSDILKIRLVEKEGNVFTIKLSNKPEQINTTEKSDELYRSLPLSAEQDTFIVETSLATGRVWQTFRSVTKNNTSYVIFSEHDFSQVDSVMTSRRQQSYFGLTAIFLFLALLAYWVRKQMDWQAAHSQLVQRLHERDLFSNMIAHEFRTPLTAIKGYASFLQESTTLTTDEKRFATNIRTSAERLVVLVNDFLEVARVQSGKVKIAKQEVDVRTILQRVTEDLQGIATEKGLKLIFKPVDKPVLFYTDADRMTQVVTNIVTNAIKYTESGSVTLECAYKTNILTIKVKDTGTGISADDQQKLFAPFTRVGGVDDSAITGSGLGMWITKQLVELLGGSVGVESIEGIGTHIVMTFKS